MAQNVTEKIEREAYRLVERCGKKDAITRCDEYIKDDEDEMRSIKFYDSPRIDKLHKNIMYWLAVQAFISNNDFCSTCGRLEDGGICSCIDF